jgi:glucose/arabinose dehydrogenase
MEKLIFTFLSLFLSATCIAGYSYEKILIPHNIDPQVGGLATLPNGNIVACFHRGEVMIYDVKTKKWSRFAEGLHEPLGIVALSNSEFMVMQRPELTLLKDTDGDGEADLYKTFFDGFGMTGNYHEFAFGPTMDKNGNYYIGLNVASNNGSIRKEIRGNFLPIGLKREEFYHDFAKKKKAAGRMYSRVPYRGWILKISPKGDVTPLACGVRSPNGLGIDADGDLFVTDNQGDWLGTSKLHHIKEGRFHGHPASLPWRQNWDGRNPLDLSIKELDKMRTPAAALFPQGILANSPTQPLLIKTDKFGPYRNQMLIGDMNFKRILRFIKDDVEGTIQGALLPHLESQHMNNGNNRLTWGKDGSLFIGRTKLSWAGNRGIQRVIWDGKVDFDVQSVTLTKEGFRLSFTKPVKDLSSLKINHYHFTYHQAYGSPRIDETAAVIQNIKLSSDGKVAHISIENMLEGKVYDFFMDKIKSSDGEKLNGKRMCYTLNKLR